MCFLVDAAPQAQSLGQALHYSAAVARWGNDFGPHCRSCSLRRQACCHCHGLAQSIADLPRPLYFGIRSSYHHIELFGCFGLKEQSSMSVRSSSQYGLETRCNSDDSVSTRLRINTQSFSTHTSPCTKQSPMVGAAHLCPGASRLSRKSQRTTSHPTPFWPSHDQGSGQAWIRCLTRTSRVTFTRRVPALIVQFLVSTLDTASLGA